MVEILGTLWRAEYGEIAERKQFRVGYRGQPSYEAYFPIAQLSDLTTVLTNVQPLGLNILALGTDVQARKVAEGAITDVVVEPRSNTFPPPIMRFELATIADLVATLQALSVALPSADPGDWDDTNVEPVAKLNPSGRLYDKYIPVHVGVTPEAFGAKGDGVTDDSSAFTAMIATSPMHVILGAGKKYLIAPNILNMPAGSLLEGSSAGNYNLGVSDDALTTQLIIKKIPGYDPTTDVALDNSSPTDTPTYWGVKINPGSICRNVKIIPPTPGTQYYDANYPGANRATSVGSATPTNNASVGLHTGASCLVENVYIESFFWGLSVDGVSKVIRAYVRQCDVGIITRGADGGMELCDVLFCNTAGIKVNGAYWRFIGNRLEWNARYGIWSSAEGTYTGNLFDRNGWAGLYLKSGSWGQVISGNYFSRNGAGGDGVQARWSWVSGPTHRAYVLTPPEESCHIKIDYQRAVAIIGNRYRHGQDDGNGGMDAPLYIYSSTASDGATAADDIEIFGNAGVRGATTAANGNSSNTNYANPTAIAGGTDTGLASFLNNYPFGMRNGVRTTGDFQTNGILKSAGISPVNTTSVNVSTIDIPILAGRSGFVVIKSSTSANTGLAVVYFGRNQGSTGSTGTSTLVENKLGTPVTTATLVADTATYDKLTVVLSGTRWTTYEIVYAS